MLQQYFNMDAREFITIPSLADAYLVSRGCYEGVYELSGVPLNFIEQPLSAVA